jgi:hypothetical protein
MTRNDGRDAVVRALLAVAALCMACSGGEGSAVEAQHVDQAPAVLAADGITVERVRASIAPSGGARRHPLTVVRFDLARYRPRLFTARTHGGSRTLDRWVRDRSLVAGINAAMYEPDGRATGYMVREDAEESPIDDPRFGGFLAFDPHEGATPPGAHMELFGRDCAGFDLASVRARYGTVVSSYRLLDCESHAIGWVDPDRYSAAAIGMDREGRLVLVHSRTPYRMRELSEMLASAELGLTQMMFVEGGPEATLIVEDGALHVREVGLRRDLPPGIEGDESTLWSLPNIIGIERIDAVEDANR